MSRKMTRNLDERQSGLLKALADETRLRLVRLLSIETLNVQELCDILEMAQPKVSRHLSILRAVQLVKDQRDGSRVYYSLPAFEGDMKWIGKYIHSISEQNHPDRGRLTAVLRNRAKQTAEFNRGRVHEWDQVGSQLHSSTAALLALGALTPRGLTVADFGTGTGLLLPVLSTFADRVYAVDQSKEMLEYAEQRCQKSGVDNVEFVNADIEDVDRSLPSRCHCVLLHFVLHQVARPPFILSKAYDVLYPGGRLVIVDSLAHDDETARNKYGSLWLGFEESKISRWLESCGFRNERFQALKKTGKEERDKDAKAIFVAAAVRPTS
jgi:ubiquinone/menaquinone biosynthesis C-methylase UbiE/DNA-binding transcriptional ArsR family regulator